MPPWNKNPRLVGTQQLRYLPENLEDVTRNITAAVIARKVAEKRKQESKPTEVVERLGPVEFAEKILGHHIWSTPRAIMESVDQPMSRTAVASCHASSKTYTAAEIILWWTSNGGVTISTAPTGEQVNRELWGELRKAYGTSLVNLGGHLLPRASEWYFGPDQYAVGRVTTDGVSFQGTHSEKVLIVLDEANGVPDDIWEAIEGIRAGGDVRILAMANPTVARGPFFDAFTKNRASWNTFVIDAFETPNFIDIMPKPVRDMSDDEIKVFMLSLPDEVLYTNPWPFLVTRGWVKEKLLEWGTESSLWQARVRGLFPEQSSDALISLAWLNYSKAPHPNSEDRREYAGIDVAGPGDDETVLTVFRGNTMVMMEAWKQADPRAKVVHTLQTFNNLVRINVDSAGQGEYFYRFVRDEFPGIRVNPINVGMKPSTDKMAAKFKNLKAELYWSLREEFRLKVINGVNDDLAISQLAGIRYEEDAKGMIDIQSKADARREHKQSSPDRAESIMLARARPAAKLAILAQGSAKGWNPHQ